MVERRELHASPTSGPPPDPTAHETTPVGVTTSHGLPYEWLTELHNHRYGGFNTGIGAANETMGIVLDQGQRFVLLNV